ncbi:ABC transporter substrate-binding protein [Neobacillus drentensis]|uniref:ABC transporter substrate-binding protein n=1 Tax=Neobacillus drentensis TaxID=220684 RepID=UPI003000914F
MKFKYIPKLITLVSLLLLFVLSGCGSKTGGSSNQPSEKEYLTNKGKLTYAMSGLLKPLNYKDKGKLVGFDVEIGEEISKRIGLKANPVTNPWETIIQGLKGKKYDAIIGSMTDTPERSKQVDFTNPYYISGAQIFVSNSNNTIKSEDDLKNKRIGIMQASTYKQTAEKYTNDIKNYPSDVYALQDLVPGRVDAVITDRIVGVSAIKQEGLQIKTVGDLLQKENISIAVNKDNPILLKKINNAIKEMVEDGTYEKISKKWFGENVLK